MLALLALPSFATAQRNFGGAFGCSDLPSHAVPYDGRFAFARLKYSGGSGNCYYRGEPSWAHGYGYTNHGTAESNLLRIAADVSAFHPHLDETAVVDVGDPALMHYPVAFMVEGAYLTLTDKEAANLHRYLMKGGFLIVDDFREDAFRGQTGWATFASVMSTVLPGLHPIDVPLSHPIFHSFFDIPTFDIIHQAYDRGPPVFRGIFENNDPTKRLLVMISFNTDISQYWEFSADGFMPISDSNEAYKIGVNYLIYALTH
jgi:hypothetical protein